MSSATPPQPTATAPAALASRIQQLLGDRSDFDAKTGAVIAIMTLGFPVIGIAHEQGLLPWWATLLIGTWLMNLSFTAWHEPAHGSFAKERRWNTAAGWLASFASVYPGYFARRREHLIHHKWQGVEGKDPVYPRIQAGFFGFPLAVAREALYGSPWDIPEDFQPMTPERRLADRVSNLLALGVIVTAVVLGYGAAIFWAWVAPRILVFGLHAYYICFFPHAVPGGGYVLFRTRPDVWWLRALTVDQHLHGIHHAWPWIPWHRYRDVARELGDDLAVAGVQSVGLVSTEVVDEPTRAGE